MLGGRFPEVFAWFVGGALLLLPVGLWLFATFNHLIRLMYEEHREEWVTFGQPQRFLRRVTGDRPAESGLATLRAMMEWPFRTPPWIRGDTEARRLLRRLRGLILVWNAGCIGLFTFLFVRYGFPFPPSMTR